MKTLLFLFPLLLIVFPVLAQSEATLSGRVVETETGQALPYVTVVLNTEAAGDLVAGTVTDAEGRFVLAGIPTGSYTLRCSFVGFIPVDLAVYIGEKNTFYDVGRIALEAATQELDDVVIEAARETVAVELDRKTFRVEDVVSQAGGSVLDVMKGLPGVTVDQEGKVHLRGSDQVAVLIDGKQSSLTGFGNQSGLDNIPAANIDHIEIINNPSARYDASGMAGIINIVYKKENTLGWNGEVGFSVGMGSLTPHRDDLPTELGSYKQTPKFIPSLDVNYRTAAVNVFLQSEVLYRENLPNNEFTDRFYTDGTRTASQVPENRTQTQYIVNGGVDWSLDDYNTFSLLSVLDYESHIDTAQVPYLNQNLHRRYRYWNWKEDEVTGFFNARLAYEHRFKEAGHDLNASVQYTRGWEDESYFLNDSTSIRQSVDTTHIVATEHTTVVQADYVKPMRSGRLEAGTKAQIRTIPVTYDVGQGEQSIIYTGLGDWSDWGETIVAGYVNYVYESKRFDVEAGLRAEQTNVYYDIAPENTYYPQNDKYDYFELFPNVRLTLHLGLKNGVSLFYNRRVDRPGEPQLRIFPKYDDPELLKVGNPYLRPQFTQTVEAAYKRIWETGSAFVSVYYRCLDDPFDRFYSIDDSNADYRIVNKIYQNLGSGNHAGIELLLSQNVSDSWKLSASFNGYNNVIDAYAGTLLFPYERPFTIEAREDRTWDVKTNHQLFLPAQIQVQLTAIYFAPKNIPQGRQLERSSIDLGVSKVILNNRGEVTLSFTDIFNRSAIRQEVTDTDFTARYENRYETQVVRLGVTYKW